MCFEERVCTLGAEMFALPVHSSRANSRSIFHKAIMKNSTKLISAMLVSALIAVPAQAAKSTLITLDDLDYRKPDKLVELMALSDAEFASLLANDWKHVENTLQKYIPAGVDFAPPVPLGFYGPWQSCMTSHYPAACREHISQLIGLMESKAKTKMKEAGASPFGT
jgi:hypothetical protein